MEGHTYMTEAFFGFAPIHVLMATAGAAIFVAYLLPRIIFQRTASSSALLMILGAVIFNLVPGMPGVPDPTKSPAIWEITSEIVVIVVLFSTGLRIDNVRSWKRWSPTVRFLVIAMPRKRCPDHTFAA